jgi:hypothetical protein
MDKVVFPKVWTMEGGGNSENETKENNILTLQKML